VTGLLNFFTPLIQYCLVLITLRLYDIEAVKNCSSDILSASGCANNHNILKYLFTHLLTYLFLSEYSDLGVITNQMKLH
jgi:hypothetical protein